MKSKQKKIITTWLYTGLVLIALMVIIGGMKHSACHFSQVYTKNGIKIMLKATQEYLDNKKELKKGFFDLSFDQNKK